MKVIIKKRKSYYALIQMFVILFLLDSIIGFMIFTSLPYFVYDLETILTICIFLFLPILLNLYLINYIFWQLRGYEIVEMTEKMLSVKRVGKLFKDNLIIPANKIEAIVEKEYKPPKFDDSIWRNPFIFSKVTGEDGGRIRVLYNTKVVGFRFKIATNFGQGLSKEDANLYVQQMNKMLTNLYDRQQQR